jgi:hypothetical protein
MKNEGLRLRLLLRSVYLKGHQDGNMKTTDLSWEDKIVKDIKEWAKGNIPAECNTFSGGTEPYEKHIRQKEIGWNACAKECRENLEREEG